MEAGAQERLAAAYRDTFESSAGRMVIEDLADFAGMASAGQADLPTVDPLRLAVDEGKRRMVQRILSFVGLAEIELISGIHKRNHAGARPARWRDDDGLDGRALARS